MRQTCQVQLPEGPCDKPAVDFIDEGDGEYFYLCAEHWDEFGYTEDDVYDDDDDSEDFG